MAKEETQSEAAVKALEAAVRKANRAGIPVRLSYTVTNEDGSTQEARSR